MIDEAFMAGWVERLRREIPGVVAVVLKGSHVRGNAGPYSDLDLDVLVFDEEIADAYLTWIVDDGSGRLVHVSVAVETVEDWLAGFREVATWSFGFAAGEVTRLMWLGRPSLRAELDRPGRDHPGGEPELEDFIEELGKARNARLRSDEIAVRLAVQEIAQLCPTLLLPLNAPANPGTRPEALKAALDLAVAPEGYRDDMLLCLGLSGTSSTVDEVLAAGERLVLGTLALLEANADMICPDLAPHLSELLSSGLLRRYLDQGSPLGPLGS
ncbi:MAG: nucleotidyltransferase domain-containing protein [Chloroflexota bacterium]|nr:nucleotidyltransferase domain-containing protein [Chloroflexota bacterium]